LMLIYTVCATRTNIIYVVIFASLILVFALLAAAYWQLGRENEMLGNRLTVVSSYYGCPLDFNLLVRSDN
jgi:succinate-acetate transporter protein